MGTLFSPLATSFLGFESLFDELDRLMREPARASTTGFPPLNLYREENGYSIELAVAGFKKSQLKIEHDKKNGVLTITGDGSLPTEPVASSTETALEPIQTRSVIRQSIAARKFSRSFKIADDLEVSDAALEDGLLTVSLRRLDTPENKPLLIPLR